MVSNYKSICVGSLILIGSFTLRFLHLGDIPGPTFDEVFYPFYGFNYLIPTDPSSAAFFIALTLLTPGSKLLIRNVNCNPTRIGFISILKKMKAKIIIKNLKRKSGELIGDILVKSSNLKPINCSKKFVPSSIDEFPLLFVIASLLKGISKFSGIRELRHKESDRIKNMEIGLNKIGIRNGKKEAIT